MDIFCQIAQGSIPSHKVYEDDQVIAFFDIAPTSYGHTLVVPKQHCDSFLDCPPELLSHMMEVAQKLANKLMDHLNCDGINILSNAKEAAGQSVPHFHIHLIPRYEDSPKDLVEIRFHEIEKPDFEQLIANLSR
ncbi:HIT family protein [Dubosiella newyorkensis]|jgi:histidine triad (HIT) family protein|uniref:HIT family protein n=1 Tax=Dubosiella newyorkensis TaxID=1862672 RepID=A0A1U7NMM1_9FIRM|nr:HIT family protein [Dubosiella newyorkensis]MCI9040377.1 HIT family protein [Dubosiella newyorkensis]OLU46476.1 HIT family protein [Dubosiella newyorkensis]